MKNVDAAKIKIKIERLRTECAKLVDENNRLQEWKDAAIAQAEDRDEYVLAQINREQADEIEQLRSEKLYHLSQIERAIEIERERCIGKINLFSWHDQPDRYVALISAIGGEDD
jgi:hypothetical protein